MDIAYVKNFNFFSYVEKCCLNNCCFQSKIELHENFNNDSLDNDIALITLKHPVNLSDSIFPICLPHQKQLSDRFINQDKWVGLLAGCQ